MADVGRDMASKVVQFSLRLRVLGFRVSCLSITLCDGLEFGFWAFELSVLTLLEFQA